MKMEVLYYLSLFWRRLPLFLLISVLVGSSGAFVALTLPPIYRAQMSLMVESAQIPTELAQSTVQISAAEQLQLFETRLLTRDNLLDVARRLKVLPDQDAMNPDQIVLAMRAATNVRSTAGRNRATVMALSFESANPAMAAKVLNEYLTFLLAEDAQYRAQRAGQTQEFFQQEVDRLASNLNAQSSKIIEFKRANSDALPDGLSYRRDFLLDLQDKLARLDRARDDLEERKKNLTQIYQATGQIGAATGSPLSPEAKLLAQLKLELANLESIYSATSPKVITLRNRIAQLESSVAAQQGQTGDIATNPGEAVFNLQIREIDSKIAQIDADRARIEAQAETIQAQIAATPANAITLEAMERDYENIQRQYAVATDRLSKASTGERIETLSRGQRVSVLEQPVAPNEPIKPNRPKLIALSIFGGLGLAGAVVLVLDLLASTIKRSADMVRDLDMVPMVTIPYMRSPGEVIRQRIYRLGLSFLIGVATPGVLWGIHTYYMPFDQIAQKLAARIGIYI